MTDHDLAAKTPEDIRTYVEANLPSALFPEYSFRLAEKAEGLFQWAAVACEYITDPPPGNTQRDCIDALLERSQDPAARGELDWLYQLYTEVLDGYFKTDYVKRRFRSVVGQLLAAFEPLSICSLTALRQHIREPRVHRFAEEFGFRVPGVIRHVSIHRTVQNNDYTSTEP